MNEIINEHNGNKEQENLMEQQILCKLQEIIRESYMAKCMFPKQSQWEAFGFVFTKIPGEDNFYKTTLPKGWSMELSDDKSSINITDNNGNIRGSINYSLNDFELTFMNLYPRYNVYQKYIGEKTYEFRFGNQYEEDLFVTMPIIEGITTPEEFENIFIQLTDYINEHYPNYKDLGAYWENAPQKKL